MRERSPYTRTDPPNWGTSFSKGETRFNQFGTMEGVISRSEFLKHPDSFLIYGKGPASLNQGYLSQDKNQPLASGPGSAQAPRFSHLPNRIKTRLQRFQECGET
jgi:hypothetical protein